MVNNLHDELLKENSKKQWHRLADWIGGDKKRMDQLMHEFLQQDYRISQCAAGVISRCVDRDPFCMDPYLDSMIRYLDRPLHDAGVRNIVRSFQFIDIPEEYLGEIVDRAFGYLNDPKTSIAIRVFSMTVIHNAVKRYPDLAPELISAIERHMDHSSAGFKSRGRKILAELEKFRH